MQLSIIILNYNVCYFLEQCLQSAEAAIANIKAEIIVVDNASKDRSCEMIAEKFPSVRLIKNHKNEGFPKGNNQGVVWAKGKYLCILNPDTVVAENTFTQLLTFIAKQKKPGIIGVKLIDGTGNFLRESKRGLPTPRVAFSKIMGLYKAFPKQFGSYYAMHIHPDSSGEVSILTGAFMFMKRSVYHHVNGFDEGCFMYADDIDLSYRVQQLGYYNYYFSETSVIHYKGESTFRDKHYLIHFRAALRFFYKKHFKMPWLLDMWIWGGIQFFSMLKWMQLRTSEKKEYQPLHYFLLSNDHALKLALEKKINKNIVLRSLLEITKEEGLKPHSEIIFDGNQISNLQIIMLLTRLKNKHYTFKIRPKNSRYILGSNHRNAKGEVIIF